MYPIDLNLAYSLIKMKENEDWNTRRYSKEKLRYYNMIKPSLDIENYLFLNIPKYKRSLFAQLRAGILPLNIETFRFRNIALENRICEVCNLNEIEDEIHFLCVCPLYNDYRTLLFEKAGQSYPDFASLDNNIDIFVFLMTNCQRDTIPYVYNSFMGMRASLYS